MPQCSLCKKPALLSRILPFCSNCIRTRFSEIKSDIEEIHSRTREKFGLPLTPPKNPVGVKCPICANECQIPEGERGFCGYWTNISGKLVSSVAPRQSPAQIDKASAYLDWYYDPLPTNCVADWVCAGGTGAGYPEYAYKQGSEYGYKNLAVFFRSCTFNCLFCQNWHFKSSSQKSVSKDELVKAANSETSCICFFGGDPTPSIQYAISVSEAIIKAKQLQKGKKIFRICWETNGSVKPHLLKKMVELSLQSGGCIKFDLKTFSESMSYALCGVSNQRTKENIKIVSEYIDKRPSPPLLIVSTLLVPGYIDEYEIGEIARFIASVDKRIPWALLAFYPCFYLNDLPRTSKQEANQALAIAQKYGIENCRIGNLHLLS